MGTFSPGLEYRVSKQCKHHAQLSLFERKTVKTEKATCRLIDGGYCANNPTLYAIADAIMALRLPPTFPGCELWRWRLSSTETIVV